MKIVNVMNNPVNGKSAERIILGGYSQGIGMRPILVRLARRYHLYGWVRNSSRGVEVQVEGKAESIWQFKEAIRKEVMPTTSNLIIESGKSDSQNCEEFQILVSDEEKQLQVPIPFDTVTCIDCFREYLQPTNRRYRYPLITCSQCGPRYSIISDMPFERHRTAMAEYKLCRDCRQEYCDVEDRRFHSQTIACPSCGPKVDGLENAIDAIRQGAIVGVRGLGGYQLVAQAHRSNVVQKIRELKGRRGKPFAVMVADIELANRIAYVDQRSANLLQSSAGPIVLLQRREQPETADYLHPTIAPGCSTVGIMLPTTAMHWELARSCGTLVVTSANLEGEPIAADREKIPTAISDSISAWVEHDRRIERVVDDSVMAVSEKTNFVVRVSRGLAPWPLKAICQWCSSRGIKLEEMVAVGAQQKVAIALSNGEQAILGPHLGDMDTEAMRGRLNQHMNESFQLLKSSPRYVVHDLHPDYFTTQWANEYKQAKAIQSIAVQHHHAHIVSSMIDNGWLDRTVLGVAWDGTGLGTDGKIWGGEFLLAQADRFERVVSLRCFQLVGGDTAIREPWRIAVGLLHEIQATDELSRFGERAQVDQLTRLMDLGINSVSTSSMGRLFDAIAVLINPQEFWGRRVTYEGEFAVYLEAICDKSETGEYPFPLVSTSDDTEIKEADAPRYFLDWQPLLRAVVSDLKSDVSQRAIAMKFHRTLALSIIAVHKNFPDYPICFSGGVFQNQVLVDLVLSHPDLIGKELGIGVNIPMNDGGVAAGQLAIGLAIIHQRHSKKSLVDKDGI
jgi:hydrogenase maturation protein HypF